MGISGPDSSPNRAVIHWLCGALTGAVLAGCAHPPESIPLESNPVESIRVADARRLSALAAGGIRTYDGVSHACAIVDSGLQCWGANNDGQLGDGNTSRRVPMPTSVIGLESDVTAIAAGGWHSCAIRAGAVHCWGRNSHRQLGLRSARLASRARPVAGLPTAATDVSAGRNHTCVIADGGVYCWGDGSYGQLGRTVERCRVGVTAVVCTETPGTVEALAGPATSLSLGDAHSCAISSGRAYCWGRNHRGQLGDGSTDGRSIATAVEPFGAANAIAAGLYHTCALASGDVWCWGANDQGQLGDGTTTDRHVPTRVTDLPSDIVAVAAGWKHSCALGRGSLHCWGSNDRGQLGRSGAARARPQPVPGLASVSAVAAGVDHTCAIAGPDVLCWGSNRFGQLGVGSDPAGSDMPRVVAPWESDAVQDRDRDGRIAIACLGDSNTQPRPLLLGWCEQLSDLGADKGWQTLNRGVGSATVTAARGAQATDQLSYSLEYDHPDAVVLAFGTNDLLRGRSPRQIVKAYRRLRVRAREHGVEAWIALTPPAPGKGDEFAAQIEATNRLIARSFPGSRVVDFFGGLDGSHFQDVVHVGRSGQTKRAQAAYRALAGVAPPAGSSP